MNRTKLLLIALAGTLILGACKRDQEPQSNNTTTTEAQAIEAQKTEDGSYVSPVVPNTNNPKVQLLIQSPYWVAEYWVNHGDNTQNAPNRGRWWKIKPDGTFECGQWEETFSYGSWAVYNDGAKELIHFDAVNDALDMEFEMQAVSQLKDYMSWAGTGTYDMKRIAVKATSLLSMPTKAQFNVPE
ncbi:MAG: hypothetical protein AAFN81_29040 [Bacteroidota bacterium]